MAVSFILARKRIHAFNNFKCNTCFCICMAVLVVYLFRCQPKLRHIIFCVGVTSYEGGESNDALLAAAALFK